MSYDELINGLKSREFKNTNGIFSMGGCHKNNKHYVLLTDGLVIYSNTPYWRSANMFPNGLMEYWPLKNDPSDIKHEFNWKEFDSILSI